MYVNAFLSDSLAHFSQRLPPSGRVDYICAQLDAHLCKHTNTHTCTSKSHDIHRSSQPTTSRVSSSVCRRAALPLVIYISVCSTRRLHQADMDGAVCRTTSSDSDAPGFKPSAVTSSPPPSATSLLSFSPACGPLQSWRRPIRGGVFCCDSHYVKWEQEYWRSSADQRVLIPVKQDIPVGKPRVAESPVSFHICNSCIFNHASRLFM